jgi:dihydrolipoamide dehydrogenase
VETADGSTTVVRFDQAIIAAGSEPVRLPFVPHDDPRVIDSTGAWTWTTFPSGCWCSAAGSSGWRWPRLLRTRLRVTVVEVMDQLIPGADKDLVTPLAKRITKRYENIWLGTKVTQVEARPDGLAGRRSRARTSRPRDSGVRQGPRRRRPPAQRPRRRRGEGRRRVDERGFIPVDKQQRTNVAHIFAIGDVVGQPMLAHKAVHEGKVAAENTAGHTATSTPRHPLVAYTDPEVAWVGVTENEAKAAGVKYGKGVFPWAASGRSLSLGRDEGMTKILFDEATTGSSARDRRPVAGDLIAEAALAIEIGADAADIGLTIHPHPTLSETVAMAAEAFEGTITDLYMPKKKSDAAGETLQSATDVLVSFTEGPSGAR